MFLIIKLMIFFYKILFVALSFYRDFVKDCIDPSESLSGGSSKVKLRFFAFLYLLLLLSVVVLKDQPSEKIKSVFPW